MEISPFSAIASAGSSSDDDRTRISGNFDTFLQLLLTQLQNQNPLEPLDTNQFTQQLVQFSAVEQAIKTNDNLQTLALLSAANAITGAVGYIGKTVVAAGNSSTIENGSANWTYQVEGGSGTGAFTVRDSAGNQVFATTGPVSEGTSTFTWDGRKSDGTLAPSGTYTLSITAADGSGGPLQVATSFSGTVEGVDMSRAEPVLLVNGREIKLTDVTIIKQAQTGG